MTHKIKNLPRLATLHALSKLSERLRSDVLDDGVLVKRYKLNLRRPLRLGSLTVERDALFECFRRSMKPRSKPRLKDIAGRPVKGKIFVDDSGVGIVQIERTQWRFDYAALLSERRETRLALLARFFSQHSISSKTRNYLTTVLGGAPLTSEAFVEAVHILESSPEWFSKVLRQRLFGKHIQKRDLLPDNALYWDQLIPPPESSVTLDSYIASELDDEWRQRIDPAYLAGFFGISLSFSSPALVPRQLFSSQPIERIISMMERACEFSDPFGLLGAVQICSDNLDRDERLVELGERLLKVVFANSGRLTGACQAYAATFIIATAYIARHETLRTRPPFWRRLAAASHASLVVRAGGQSSTRQKSLIPWAVKVSGKDYLLAVFSDFVELPRWRPEWISEDYLSADLYGRATMIIGGMAEARVPRTWQDCLKAFLAKSKKKMQLEIFSRYPAIIEGSRPANVPTIELMLEKIEIIRDFNANPNINNLLYVGHIFYSYGFPKMFREKVLAVIQEILRSPMGLDDRKLANAIAIASHVAAESRDADLASRVVAACLAKVESATEPQSAAEAAFRIVECAGAQVDRSIASSELARNLEQLAFLAPAGSSCENLADLLRSLKDVRPAVAHLLGRAVAAADLGRGGQRNPVQTNSL